MLTDRRLQELYVKLSFTLVSAYSADSRLPDVMGIVARAQSSAASTTAQREIAQVGEYVCDSSTAQSFERGIIQYAQAVTELDVRFLEQVREEICAGMDGFDLVMSMKGAVSEKQRLFKLAAFLVSLLERIAERLDTYFVELSAQSLYHPELEDNPARARWRLVRRRINDGSFFLYTQDLTLDSDHFDAFATEPLPTQKPSRGRQRESVSFDRVISQANFMVQQNAHPPSPQFLSPSEPRRLADSHTLRASDSGRGPSSYEKHLDRKAANRVSTFLSGNLKAIRRLSRVDLTGLEHAIGRPSERNQERQRSRSRAPTPPVQVGRMLHLRDEDRGRRSHSRERRVDDLSRSASSASSGSSPRTSALPGSPRDSLKGPQRRVGTGGSTRRMDSVSVSGRSDGAKSVARALEGLRVRG